MKIQTGAGRAAAAAGGLFHIRNRSKSRGGKSGFYTFCTRTSCYESGSAKSGRNKGLALIMVLWIVAALSLLVVGMSQTVRGQVRAAQAVSEQVAAQALAEGAIALALQQLKAESARPEGMAATRVSYGGVEMQVLVQPLSGLISLNAAQPPLLSALLQVAGGVPEKQADQLAHAIDTWRAGGTGDATRRVPRRQFESADDLLLVPGMDYATYARIRPLVTADTYQHTNVNPLAAPLPVLLVLARGNAAVAQRIASRRDAGEAGVDTTGLDPALTGAGFSQFFRVTARVPLDAGRIFSLAHDVTLSAYSSSIAPWRTLRTQGQVLPAGS